MFQDAYGRPLNVGDYVIWSQKTRGSSLNIGCIRSIEITARAGPRWATYSDQVVTIKLESVSAGCWRRDSWKSSISESRVVDFDPNIRTSRSEAYYQVNSTDDWPIRRLVKTEDQFLLPQSNVQML
jgi:hypothetical protein